MPGSLKPIRSDPETEAVSLETEKRVHRVYGTLQNGITDDALQPGGPHKGRLADISFVVHRCTI